ncbi:hypothetical protein [Klebsiella pneumoniae]|uniref:hypothetical protein n=1 Tax=Klebsiella pneumoniae TaxID=573 RepID=UPI001CD60FA1|nr:hypothetical protein [Klebsiella pneumoniae]
MPKSPAERKAAQRARQSAAGERKLELVLDELVLDEQEQEMLARNCAARRPGRASGRQMHSARYGITSRTPRRVTSR